MTFPLRLTLATRVAPASVSLSVRARSWCEDLAERIPPSRDRAVVAALVALAFLLRIPNLGRAYWIDEGITVGLAGHPVGQIPRLLRHDGSPPLFYVLLHYWMLAFGKSPHSTHLLALLISVAIIPLAYWAGQTVFGRAAGLSCAALTATNPFLNWYGTETRMYTLVVALVLVAVTLTIRAVRARDGLSAVAAVLAFAALAYTHNWGLYLVAVTTAVVSVWVYRGGYRPLLFGVVSGAVAVLALYVPWLPSLFSQVRHTGAPWAISPGIGDLFADPASTLGGTLGFVVAPLLAVGVWQTHRQRSGRDRESVTVLGCIGVGTSVFGWSVSQLEPAWTIRYLAVVLAPLLLGAAGALASTAIGRMVVGTVCVIMTAWSAIGSLLPNPNATFAKSNVAAVTAAAQSELQPGDLVITTQTEQLAVLAADLPTWLTFATPTGPVADPTVVDWRNLVSRLQHANPCQTIGPSLAALPPGAHVLEINPLHAIGALGSTWARAANDQVNRIDALLARQSSLIPEESYIEGVSPKPYSAVVGELFTKTDGPITCQ